MIYFSIHKKIKYIVGIVFFVFNFFVLSAQTSTIKSTSFYQSDAVFTEVQISNFVDMTGMQMSFNWDPSLLKLEDVDNAEILNSESELLGDESFGFNSPYPGTLIVSWVHLDSLTRTINAADDFILFTIEFQNLSNTNDGDIMISETPQHVEIIRFQNGESILAPFNTLDCIDTNVNTHDSISSLANVEVYPNPLSVSATFDIEGIKEKEFSLFIYNSIGQLLRTEMHSSHLFTFSRDFMQEGIYYYELRSAGRVFSTGKLSFQ